MPPRFGGSRSRTNDRLGGKAAPSKVAPSHPDGVNLLTNVTMAPGWEGMLLSDPAVGRVMKQVAEQVKDRVTAPKKMQLSTKGGIGGRDRQAFSQVIMKGPRATTIEFGSKTRRAKAPLRKALTGKVKL